MSKDNVVKLPTATNISKTNLENYVSAITEQVKGGKVSNIICLCYSEDEDDFTFYVVGSYKLNSLLGDLELLKDSVLQSDTF